MSISLTRNKLYDALSKHTENVEVLKFLVGYRFNPHSSKTHYISRYIELKDSLVLGSLRIFFLT